MKGELVIPDTVTSIGYEAFRGCSSLTSITIPESVTSIGRSAFWDCSSLNEVNYLGNLEDWCKISFGGSSANPMYYAKKLYINGIELKGELVIPDTVTSIGSYAFRGCSNLTTVNFAENSQCTSIGESAFSGCSSLTSVTIPESVTSIGSSAFYGCSSLTSVTIPESVTSIGDAAFRGCSSLTSVTIPESVTSIGDYAFEDCSSLNEVNYLGSLEDWCKISFGGSYANPMYYAKKMFANAEPLGTTIVLHGVEYIGGHAFDGMDKVTSIVIKDSNRIKICTNAFYGCPKAYIFIEASQNNITFENDWNPQNRSVYFGTAVNYSTSEFYVEQQGNGLIIKKYLGNSETVVIPDVITLNGADFAVTEIGAGIFAENNKIKKIVIGCNIANIVSARIFAQCPNLQEVVIADNNEHYCIYNQALYNKEKTILFAAMPYANGQYAVAEGTTTIYSFAFENHSKISSVYIPQSVNFIGSLAFKNMVANEMFTVDENNEHYISKDGVLFNKQGTTLICYPCCKSDVSYTINSDVVLAERYAFEGTQNLKQLTLSLKCLGEDRFLDLIGEKNSVEQVILTDTTSIPYRMFENCSSLTSITIPASVTSIGSDAFWGCSSLNEVNYLGSLEDWCKISFGGSYANPMCYAKKVYINGIELTGELVIPDTVTSIGWFAFYGCSSLTSITIPASVTSIGSDAFWGCSSLNEVNYLGSLEDWCKISFGGSYANPMCYAKKVYINGIELTGELVIPDTVTSIGWFAFYGCSSLTSITIPASVTSIGSDAFEYCSSLTSVTIPASVTSIGRSAFYGCSSLTNINCNALSRPNGWSDSWLSGCNATVTWGYANYTTDVIFDYCVANNKAMLIKYKGSETEVVIPSTIDNYEVVYFGTIFSNNQQIVSVTIPASVTHIGDYAFSGCSKLESVYYGGTAEQWNVLWIGSSNSLLTNATRYYYSENEPTLNVDGTAYDGNYWHYVDGNVVVWTKED